MKLLLATDLHYIPNLAEELAANAARLPASTYNHEIEGKLYWHNQLMVECGDQLIDGLERIARQEQPELFIFLGDMVNVNWQDSIEGVAARLKHFPCPVRQVLGNHDIYLGGEENRLQAAVTPGTYESGIRHEVIGGLGLIYLDLFVRSDEGESASKGAGFDVGSAGTLLITSKGDPNAAPGTPPPLAASVDSGAGKESDSSYRKWVYPPADSDTPVATSSEAKEYRAQDIAAAIALMKDAPDTPWLIIGHYPFVTVNPRVLAPGRKLAGEWPSAIPLANYLQQANNLASNLLGILCGHQHLAHFQAFAHGFHWHLPALVEYPCAAAILEWDGSTLQGRILPVDEQLAAASLQVRQESWSAGEDQDRHFVWRAGA